MIEFLKTWKNEVDFILNQKQYPSAYMYKDLSSEMFHFFKILFFSNLIWTEAIEPRVE